MISVYSKHHLLTMSGGPISVYESGDERLPPVLLLHGAMCDEARLIWYHLAPFLSKMRHVFAIDFPRHGKSRPWLGTIDQSCLNQVVGEVITHFNLPPLPLIGLSMGGGVSIGYMLQNPEQVTGAVLIGPGGLGDKITSQFASWLFVKTPGTLSALTNYYGKMKYAKFRKMVVALLHDGEKSKNFDDLVELIAEEAVAKMQYKEKCMDDWQLVGLAPFHMKMNFLPEIHKISCPTLWIRGENDPLVGQAVMEEAVHFVQKGELKVIKNAGHLVPLEQPDEVNQAVADFLSANRI